MEKWINVKGFESEYQVSTFGNVRSKDRRVCAAIKNQKSIPRKGQTITIKNGPNGYKFVILYKEGKSKMFLLHRLVAINFIPNPDNKKHINHIDSNKSNNVLTNLEWCSALENKKHAKENGLIAFGEKIGVSKLKESEVLYIRSMKNVLSSRKLGLKLNTSSSNICDIWNRKTWKHI